MVVLLAGDSLVKALLAMLVGLWLSASGPTSSRPPRASFDTGAAGRHRLHHRRDRVFAVGGCWATSAYQPADDDPGARGSEPRADLGRHERCRFVSPTARSWASSSAFCGAGATMRPSSATASGRRSRAIPRSSARAIEGVAAPKVPTTRDGRRAGAAADTRHPR